MESEAWPLSRIALDLLATVILVLIIISLREGNDPDSLVYLLLIIVSAGWLLCNSVMRYMEKKDD